MSSKNKKAIDNLLSDSSEEVPVTKKTKKVQRKASDSASVDLLKKKRKQSKDKKRKESSDESDSPVKSKANKKVVSKKKDDSDDESDAPAKKLPVKKGKADSDSESEPKRKVSKGKGKEGKKVVSKESDSDSDAPQRKQSVRSTRSAKKAETQEDDGETHAELFVKNLSWNSNDDSVYNHFAKFGTVLNVKLLSDKMTGKPKGIGFVGFEKRSDAKKALENCGELDGRNPTCSWSNQKEERTGGFGGDRRGGFGGDRGRGGFGGDRGDRGDRGNTNFSSGFQGEAHTVFVGNLGFKTNENTVKNFFAKAGNVVGVRIAKDMEGKAKGFCHVDFDSKDAATAAVAFAGQNLDGRDIRVDMSEPRKNRGEGGFRGGDRGGRGGDRGGRGGRGGFSKPTHAPMGTTGKKTKFDSDSD